MNEVDRFRTARQGLTVCEARARLDKAQVRGLLGMSRINPRLTLQEAYVLADKHLASRDPDSAILEMVAYYILTDFGD